MPHSETLEPPLTLYIISEQIRPTSGGNQAGRTATAAMVASPCYPVQIGFVGKHAEAPTNFLIVGLRTKPQRDRPLVRRLKHQRVEGSLQTTVRNVTATPQRHLS